MVSLRETCRCLSSFGSMVWLTFGFTLRLELAQCLTMHAMSPHSLLTSRWLWRELDPPRSRQTWTSSENTTSSSMRTSFTLLPRTPSQSMGIVLFWFGFSSYLVRKNSSYGWSALLCWCRNIERRPVGKKCLVSCGELVLDVDTKTQRVILKKKVWTQTLKLWCEV